MNFILSLIQMEPKYDLIRYRHDLEVVRNTALQVIKDFGLFSIDITFSGNEATAYEELKTQLQPVLLELYNSDYNRLKSLLYRIDMPEQKVKALPAVNKDDMIAGLTDLILERELIKVITRKLYSARKK